MTTGSFLGLLGLLFIGLKLTHVISWSWWWVTSPIWIPFALFAVLMLLLAIFYIIGMILTALTK